MEPSSYVRAVLHLHPAFNDTRIVSGVTTTDISFVDANAYNTLAESLHIDRQNIKTVHQVHGNTVINMAPGTMALGTSLALGTMALGTTEADGLITNNVGIVLGIKIADCAGVLLWDPEKKCIGAVHSGWRGTSQNIIGVAVQKLSDEFGSDPQNIRAYISPHATVARYEVGSDVHAVLGAFCIRHHTHSGKWLFDNAAAITSQLVQAGVPRVEISIDPACTMIDMRFHSHRRDGVNAGRGLAYIGIK